MIAHSLFLKCHLMERHQINLLLQKRKLRLQITLTLETSPWFQGLSEHKTSWPRDSRDPQLQACLLVLKSLLHHYLRDIPRRYAAAMFSGSHTKQSFTSWADKNVLNRCLLLRKQLRNDDVILYLLLNDRNHNTNILYLINRSVIMQYLWSGLPSTAPIIVNSSERG